MKGSEREAVEAREQTIARASRAQTVAAHLAELGVKARHRGEVVEVLDPEALGRLLCRLE